MTLSLVFNELSLRCPAPDIHTARNRMTEFVETLKTAAVHNVTVLRMRDNFKDFALCPEYPMGAWFGDNSVSRDEREFVLAYATQYSFIRPYDGDLRGDEEFPSDRLLFEGRFGDERAEGLGFAYLLKGLTLSILSETCWDTPWLDLDCEEFNSESDEIEESRVVLRHVSRSRHVSDDHAAWIEERIRDGICTGLDLLRVANARFPRMVFCNDARKHIEALTESSMQLPRVRERLFELGQLIDAWEQGRFNYHQIHNASEESPSTIGRYGDRREFVCPDGQRRLFSWHLKGLPQMWRIHIWADQEERNVLIGYVGKHLPTDRNPT